MALAMGRLVLIMMLWFGGPAMADEPAARTVRQHEILQHRPSGFWTSNRPAEHGAYRWRLLGIGVVLAGITGLVMWRLVRKASAARRAGPPASQ